MTSIEVSAVNTVTATTATFSSASWFSGRAHALRRSLKCSGSGCTFGTDQVIFGVIGKHDVVKQSNRV